MFKFCSGQQILQSMWIHSNSDFCCKLHHNPEILIGTNKHMLNHFAKLDSTQLMWWSAKPGRNDSCHPFNEQTARLKNRTFNMCLSSMDINHSHISLSAGLKFWQNENEEEFDLALKSNIIRAKTYNDFITFNISHLNKYSLLKHLYCDSVREIIY